VTGGDRQLVAALVERHTITWHKVKGHAGVTLNERCDELAVAACHTARQAA
jgi:ribonuclease HI